MPLTAFVEERLELGIPIGMAGGPGFETEIDMTDGGVETRNVTLEEEIGEWDIGQRQVLRAEWQTIQAFFRVRRGQAVGWRIKIWSDYELTDEVIGTGDDSTVLFQITQTSDTGYGEAYVRRITKPVANTLVVKVDGVATLDYTLDATLGQITFDTAPAAGEVISVSCEFDTPVRFATDRLPPAFIAIDPVTEEKAFDLPPIPIREISPEEILQ